MKKTITNEIRCTFLSKSENEALARSIISGFLIPLDPDVEELADIRCAVSEAVTNCIVHAYKNGIGVIYISAKIFENGKIAIKIRDKGCGIPNIEQAMEPLFTTGGSERAGLGFAVMQSFMDKVKVCSKAEKGTTITLEKNIIRRAIKNGH